MTAKEYTVTAAPDKSCQINLHNVQGWDLDPGMLEAVMQRVVARHATQAEVIDIYPQERLPSGWIEWISRVKYRGGGWLTIATIQRNQGNPYETHS